MQESLVHTREGIGLAMIINEVESRGQPELDEVARASASIENLPAEVTVEYPDSVTIGS